MILLAGNINRPTIFLTESREATTKKKTYLSAAISLSRNNLLNYTPGTELFRRKSATLPAVSSLVPVKTVFPQLMPAFSYIKTLGNKMISGYSARIISFFQHVDSFIAFESRISHKNAAFARQSG